MEYKNIELDKEILKKGLVGIFFVLSSCGGSSNLFVASKKIETETDVKSEEVVKKANKNKSGRKNKQISQSTKSDKKSVPFLGIHDTYAPGNFINSKLFHYQDQSTYILAEDNLLGRTVGDLASMGQTDEDIKQFIDEVRALESSGKITKEVSLEIRRGSPYGVKTADERYLFFDEALEKDAKIVAFNDPAFAFTFGKEQYFDFLLSNTDFSIEKWRKSRRKVKSYSKIQDNLKSIYSVKNLQTLSDSFPSYESEGKKLAAIIMDLIIWDQISTQVSTQVRSQAWTHIGDEAWAKVWPRVVEEVGIHIGVSIRNQIWAQIWDQIREQVGVRIGHHVLFKIWTQVRSQVEDKVNKNLQHLQFASAHRKGNLSEALKSAIDYTLTVYQLGSVVIRHSIEVVQIQDDLARFISVEMDTDEIEAVLKNLNIPELHEHYIIDNQLKIIRSHLISDD